MKHGAEGDELAVLAGGMDAIREENNEHVGLGIDPDGRACEAGVTERAGGEIPARRGQARRLRVPPERTGFASLLLFRELIHSGFLQHADAVQLAAVQQHLREP